MTKLSVPADDPVICQLAVAVPVERVPMFTVGLATENRPFWELREAVTLDRTLFMVTLFLFSIITDTVFVSPTLIVAGNMFPAFPSRISRY